MLAHTTCIFYCSDTESLISDVCTGTELGYKIEFKSGYVPSNELFSLCYLEYLTYYLRVFLKSLLEGSLNMVKLCIINNATYMLMFSVPLFTDF